ncbi:hypothetical protein KCTCHS21_06970 [Cohnella abietis]|uniref:HTH-type transcriptional activator Btr n=2 Tax=Cohnella abietis TaxID=2507935 RepID=A0A3T1CZP5_9BACL|nr:hypothetical protein KCTCHS21_06970 [Cohnella abietis]
MTLAKQINEMIFHIFHVEHTSCTDQTELSSHFVSTYQVIFVSKGKGRIEINGEVHLAEAGKTFFLQKGKKVQITSNAQEPLEFYEIAYSYKSRYQTNGTWQLYKEEGITFPIEGEVYIGNHSQALHLFEQLYVSAQEQEDLRQYRQKSLFMEFIYIVLKGISEQQHDIVKGMEHTFNYLKTHYMEMISLDFLAEMAGFSPSYYSRLFKKIKGVSPTTYITKLRIERAKELLVLSNSSYQDIAQSVGYKEESYFSRMFKKETGHSPAHYLKLKRKKIAIMRHTFNGDLLALGVTPHVSVRLSDWDNFHLKDQLKDSRVIAIYDSHSLDDLIRFEPDIIVSDREWGNKNEDLSLIAPTVVISYWELDWRQRFLQIANVIGKHKEARGWLTRYDRKAMQAQVSIKAYIGDKTVLILRIIGGKLRVYGMDRNIGCVLYEDLQITPPQEVRAIKWRKAILTEDLPKYGADMILIMCSPKRRDQKLWEQVQLSSEWQGLTAVRSSQWHLIDIYPWIDYSALSHELMIDRILSLLTPSNKTSK